MLTFKDLATIAGITETAFRRQMDTGGTALAFGAPRGGVLADYLPLDAVAMELTDELAERFGRKPAAVLIRLYFDTWAAAVALADHGETVGFVVFEYGRKGSRDHRLQPAYAPKDDFPALIDTALTSQGATQATATATNINKVLARLRERAVAAGVDLSAPFLPPPDSPELESLLEKGKANRRALLQEIRAEEQERAIAERVAAERAGRAVNN